jgi:energy-coupling factor transporter ATP-binding protein EcfA2
VATLPPADGSVLRTLAPALGRLGELLRQWLQTPHFYPLPAERRAALEQLAHDLQRQAEALEHEKPLLLILLMGGTGVGKSTLLNALAGAAIAPASITRPTTRAPVVYRHASVPLARLDPLLQRCQLVVHDRPSLEQKVIIDAPDLDSNDLSNREMLRQLLPLADVVLYVGSQEKYHDRLGWELFLEQRQRRAFAFVLNKWDRCQQPGHSGLRPDQDLLGDLKSAGFSQPLLFRTCARYWLELASGEGPSAAVRPEGEEFPQLVRWLEEGLSRREIEAIKARGVSQLLGQLLQTLEAVQPPDLSEAAVRTQKTWRVLLEDEACRQAGLLLDALEPCQRDIEHYFSTQRRLHFRGLMGAYLGLVNRLRYLGRYLRPRLPGLARIGGDNTTAPRWDLSAFTRAVLAAASERVLESRHQALAHRLLVAADQAGFPLALLHEAAEQTARSGWQSRYADLLREVLGQVELEWSQPRGLRRFLQGGLLLLTDWLPLLAFLAALAIPLWRFFFDAAFQPTLAYFLLPFLVLLSTLVLLHVLITLLLPLRWSTIRNQLRQCLQQRLHTELEQAYAVLPTQTAQTLAQERQQVEQLLQEVRQVADWLRQQEQTANVAGLFGAAR